MSTEVICSLTWVSLGKSVNCCHIFVNIQLFILWYNVNIVHHFTVCASLRECIYLIDMSTNFIDYTEYKLICLFIVNNGWPS